MLKNRENIRVLNIDAVIILFVLLFGLLVYNNSVRSNTGIKSKPVSSFMSVSENIAVSSPCIRIQVFQKVLISNKDNFNLLAFNRNPLSESKKTGIVVSHFQIIRQSSHKIPQSVLRYHLFPTEKDEPPYIS
jgi:hypothetical protein